MSSSSYLVVGAGGGIGTALCRHLVAAGHQVMLSGRDESRLQTLSQELGQPYLACDATDWDQLSSVVDSTADQFENFAGAVNLAGSILLKPAHLTSKDDLQAVLNANLITAFGLVRAVAPKLKKLGGGSIVLMSSGGAAIGLTSHEAIAAAKAGVAAMARAAAATYAAGNVRINTVAPGLVQTELTSRVWQNERSADASRAMHPMGRLGQPDDIASLIAWLLQPENAWITGQDIAVDGGLSSIKSATR
ncbi:SDR family NAD(P)-dependent oxidoreductase [Rhodopirellula halodulae]|uniref:SDR family NAD(P)-dependent oxidoreductase n=1 Tax=Rhodopirellula halodulae TaxID=2894198 RepID=UPI001E311C05|nr:SDR family oxidoreductase [Rhodopirellula sp. JC737]MCC9657907.1 SDR family oxidoreductase [Rhodopirellula sp. JC737]